MCILSAILLICLRKIEEKPVLESEDLKSELETEQNKGLLNILKGLWELVKQEEVVLLQPQYLASGFLVGLYSTFLSQVVERTLSSSSSSY